MSRLALLSILLVGCSSGSSSPKPKADEPPAAKNINKLVIGGDNTKPQMGLFALKSEDAKQVDAAMRDTAKSAYELAQKLAVKAWAGDRTFCEDAVRQTIHFLGTDGMMSPEELQAFRTTNVDELRRKHGKAINELHFEMMNERNEAACEKSLTVYAEALKLAATDKLELRNFGY